MSIKRIILIVILTGFSSVGICQDFNKAKLDSLFLSLLKKNKGMGSLVILKDGDLVYSKTFGFSHESKNKLVPITTHTKFRIGSVTNLFTATLIMKMVENKQLELDRKLVDFFPDIPNSNIITIHHLLFHQSGLYDFTSEPDYQEWMQKPVDKERLLGIISSRLPLFTPGSKGSFSNTNYLMLGYILEKVSGKSYSQLLKEWIADKISLKDTYYGSKINPQVGEARSYVFEDYWLQVVETDLSIPHSAGAIVSKPSDLAGFMDALVNGKIISYEVLEHMAHFENGFGMGLFKFPFSNKMIYGSTGGIDGFVSAVCYIPADSITVAYCSNGVAYPVPDLLNGVISIYYNEPYEIPKFPIVKIAEEEMKKLTGNYTIQTAPVVYAISVKKGKLHAEATGQEIFSLEPTGLNTFTNYMNGIVMEFIPERNEMVLIQSGSKFLFTKR